MTKKITYIVAFIILAAAAFYSINMYESKKLDSDIAEYEIGKTSLADIKSVWGNPGEIVENVLAPSSSFSSLPLKERAEKNNSLCSGKLLLFVYKKTQTEYYFYFDLESKLCMARKVTF